MTIVAEGSRRRTYLSPTVEHEKSAYSADEYSIVGEARATFLSPSTPTRAMITGGVCSAYGLRTYGHLFTSRQLVSLTTLSDLVGEARERVLADAKQVSVDDGSAPSRRLCFDAQAYADAVATYLGLSVSRQVNRGCTLNFWDNTSQKIQQVFGRQACAMTWDYVETNFFSNSTGNFVDQVNYPAKSIETWYAGSAGGSISHLNAPRNTFPVRPVIISTDPPYYDNISYANLSDFFYIWLKLSLHNVWSELFRRVITPKDEELIVMYLDMVRALKRIGFL